MTVKSSHSINRRNLMTGALLVGAGAVFMDARSTPSFAQGVNNTLHTLPPLPYAFTKNEPHIDALTMEIHHDKHHAAYVSNLNAALKDQKERAVKTLNELLEGLDKIPEGSRKAIRNNAGGHANHTMFWEIMGGTGGEPSGELKASIERDFGSFEKMQDSFNKGGLTQFGSGWVFITVDKEGKLELAAMPNQDTPLMQGKRVLMGNDVWEHAYYLKYQNRRADYLKAWWNVLNWQAITDRFEKAKAGTLTI